MRFAITIMAVLIGLAVVLGTLRSAQTPPRDQPTARLDTAADPVPDQPDQIPPLQDNSYDAQHHAQTSADSDKPQAVVDAPIQPSDALPDAASIDGLHAVTVTDGRETVIGSVQDGSPFKMSVELSRYGAAVRKITLTDYLQHVGKPEHYIVHDKLAVPDPTAPDDRSKDSTFWLAYAAKAVTVNGTRIALENNDVWSARDVIANEQNASVRYTATLTDAQDQPILKIVRRYSLKAGSYDLTLGQELINLTDHPLSVRFEQNLQGDLVNDSGYLGDRRQYVAGYFALWWDPQRERILTQDADLMRRKAVGAKGPKVWPVKGLNPQAELAWLASLNRYFAVVTHAPVDDSVQKTADVPPLQALFPHIDQSVKSDPRVVEPKNNQKVMVLKAATDVLTIGPGQSKDLTLSVFAGPRKPELFQQAPYSVMHLDQTIVYSLGGACAFFTFQWLAHGLLWLLKLFEGQVLVLGGFGIGIHDWGLSIILLVALVRLMLHPITKRAQINMMKMGKMMQAIQPEVEKLKKKYKDDQPKINTEMMKLYKEKGVNPANVLGCLPMLLQSPIWIALYAMLYFAIELRHEPAFWGLFQWVSGGSWGFLADLSSADNFLQISDTPFKLNLLFIHPHFQAINILPILMAVVFFFQQKLTTPPPANEQAAQQQKMMKYLVFIFPVFLYSAPSGLTLYILASTTAGVIDSYIVRKHIKEQEESGELFKPKEVKPGGFRDRIARAIEAKQQQLTQQPHKGGRGGKPRKRK